MGLKQGKGRTTNWNCQFPVEQIDNATTRHPLWPFANFAVKGFARTEQEPKAFNEQFPFVGYSGKSKPNRDKQSD